MANLTLPDAEFTSRRFARFIAASGLERRAALGQLLLFWDSTRVAGVSVIEPHEVLHHIEADLPERERIAQALRLCGYLVPEADGLRIDGNAEAIARILDKRQRGTKGGRPKARARGRTAKSKPQLVVASSIQTDEESRTQAACRATWQAYAEAYERMTTSPPVRNSKINAQIRQIVQRIGAQEAPDVIRFYVEKVTDRYIVQALWPLELFLKYAEGYVTQWRVGRPITFGQADSLAKTADYHQRQKDILSGRV